jgi:hypothetical protein
MLHSWGTGEVHTGFRWENLRDNNDVKTYAYMDDIKMGPEVEWRAWDCIDLTQDRDKWEAFVNVVMNTEVP